MVAMLLMASSTSEQHEMARLHQPTAVGGEDEHHERSSTSKKERMLATTTTTTTRIKQEPTFIKQEDIVSSSSATPTAPPTSLPLRTQYGAPIPVTATGAFPEAGSILGPYFCLGTLGKGTFSSIHKCINLDYAHQSQIQNHNYYSNSSSSHSSASSSNNHRTKKCRLAAAKVELSTFANSGVLLGEALVLNFLDEVLPRGTVPVYMGHYTAGEAAAIVMEYLPGEDMHQLRENRNAISPTGKAPRRLTIDDAVYLTAEVMLPLLEKMHKVGIVHRDVKPSNCVRSKGRQFCMVDFGLSKSIVVPVDSGYADPDHPWPEGQPWLVPPDSSSSQSTTTTTTGGGVASSKNNSKNNNRPKQPTWQPGCYRKERSSADFRGTSMYASPRVHQGRDYCPRDDVWSLLYVFCDLVSGGLPWMSHAANRDRDMCQKIKEQVHGLPPSTNSAAAAAAAANAPGSNSSSSNDKNKNGKEAATQPLKDETEKLLMGDDYHVALYKHQQRESNNTNATATATSSATTTTNDSSSSTNNIGSTSTSPTLPKPLEMSQDKTKIQLLRRAFSHLAKLQFWDQPDYALIKRCIQGFLDEEGAVGEVDDIEIEWTEDDGKNKSVSSSKKRKRDRESRANMDVPKWDFCGESPYLEIEEDPLINTELFEDVAVAAPPDPQGPNGKIMSESEAAMRRLPLEQQFRIAQMEYHANHPKTAIPHIVLRDWMKVAVPLLYKDWDAKAYESGGHRTSSDGYRREFYLELVEKCIKWAKRFDNFSKTKYLGYVASDNLNGVKIEEGEDEPLMKRQIVSTFGSLSAAPNSSDAASTDLIAVSKVLFGLQAASRAERSKSFAPPPLLSFGPSR